MPTAILVDDMPQAIEVLKADLNDKCPDVKGTLENNGCPLSKAEEVILLDIQRSVQFETGRSVLTANSKPKLDQLISILKKHPSLKMKVEGHTDSKGDPSKNLQLSKDRARACMTYLTNNGIPIGRLQSNGFGSSKPVATNTTDEGRERNRRVEFISY